MIARVKTTIGGVTYEFEIDEKEEKETLHKAIVLSSPRKKCNVCEDFGYAKKYLTTNKSSNEKGTFTYINCKCGNCGARSGLGEYKTGGYFWKDYEKYEGKTSKEEPPMPEEE